MICNLLSQTNRILRSQILFSGQIFILCTRHQDTFMCLISAWHVLTKTITSTPMLTLLLCKWLIQGMMRSMPEYKNFKKIKGEFQWKKEWEEVSYTHTPWISHKTLLFMCKMYKIFKTIPPFYLCRFLLFVVPKRNQSKASLACKCTGQYI